MTDRRDRESPEAGTVDAQIARIAPSTCGNLGRAYVFLLRGLVDRWTAFGVPLSHGKTLTRCEVILAVDAPDPPNVGTTGEMLCFVELRFAEDGISFYSDPTKDLTCCASRSTRLSAL